MASLPLSSVRTVTITLAGIILCAILVTGEAHRTIRHRPAIRQHGAFTHAHSPAITPKTTADESFYLASEPQPPDVRRAYGQFQSDEPFTQRSRTVTKLPAQYSSYREPEPQSPGQNTTARPEIPESTSKLRSTKISREVYFEEMLPSKLRPASSSVVKYDYNGIPDHNVPGSALSQTASLQASSHVAEPAVSLPFTTSRAASVPDASFQPALSPKAGTHSRMSFPVSKPAASPIAGPGAKLYDAASKPAAPPISSHGNRSHSFKRGLIPAHPINSLPPPTSPPKVDGPISSGLFPSHIPASVPSSLTPPAGYPLLSGVIQSLRGAQFRAFAGALESLHGSVIRSGMTLFAPNDNSLSAVNIDAATVADVLMRLHAVNQGAFNFSELMTLSVGTRLMTLSRFSVVITNNSANNFHVNNALITFPDVYSANGVAVHGINAVLDAYAYNGPPPVSTPRHPPTHPPHPGVPTQSPTTTDHKELPSPGPLHCTCPKLNGTVCLQCQLGPIAPHSAPAESPQPSLQSFPKARSSAALSPKLAAASKLPSLLTAALLVLCCLSIECSGSEAKS